MLLREKEICGQVVELGQNDFLYKNLSEKYGKILYKKHKEGVTNKGKPNEFNHIQIACLSELGFDINVKVLLTTENKVMLENYKMLDEIGFEDAIVGFYTGQYDQPTQTIKANKVLPLKNSQPPRK